MIRLFALVLALLATPVMAQELAGLARLDVAQSGATDRFRRAEIDLYLSQPVPYRVFTLDSPARLVLDFREVDFRGADPSMFTVSDWIDDARFGALRPGWSRMILDLSSPIRVEEAGMTVDWTDGAAQIQLVLRATNAEDFATTAGQPDDAAWPYATATAPTIPDDDGPIVIVIDPGHGGIDSGAIHGDVREADIMLSLAFELRAALDRIEGVQAVLTRSDDTFVPLQERLTRARGAGADLFISLHADALEGLQATGASVYTLTQEAEEGASQRMVERHDRRDLLAGVDLTGQSDEVAVILQDLARLDTAASGNRFADQLVQAMTDTGAVLNRRPRRQAPLAVLNAADFASVLLEVGFLSNPEDRARLTSPAGRSTIVDAVALAVGRWAIEEAALAPLNRQ